MRQTKEFADKECEMLREQNPNDNFKVVFCDKADEWVTQVLEENGNWLCLHNH